MKTKLVRVFALSVGLLWLAGLTLGDQKDKEKDPKGTILYTVTAADIAKEFVADAKAAEKKYDPNPPKGGAGGAIINIGGEFDSLKGGDVILKTGEKVAVRIEFKKSEGPKDGRRIVDGKAGKFKAYHPLRKEIVLEYETITFKMIIGDNKKD